MEFSKAHVLGVGVLVVAGVAVGLYVMNQAGSETVEPGSFADVSEGLLVGAGSSAIDEPMEVRVEWADPSGEQAFDHLDASVEQVDRVAEITVEGTASNGSWVPARSELPFLIALPVPDGFDEEHLVGVQLQRTDVTFRDAVEDEVWTYKSGVFDPEEGLFLTNVPLLGTEGQPTRIGVVEHDTKETEVLEGAVEAARQTLSGQAEHAASAPADGAALAFASQGHPASGSGALLDARTLSFQFPSSASGADGFAFDCKPDSCPSARERAAQDALVGASDVFEDLAGTQGPLLPRTTYEIEGSSLEMENFEWDLEDASSNTECPGIGGLYTGSAFTCMDTGAWTRVDGTHVDPLDVTEIVTAHELFHAYQYKYGHSDGDGIVTEGTARLVQDWEAPLELSRIDWPPVVTESMLEEPPYRYEYFFHHLFQRHGLAIDDLGHLFERGLHLEHLDEFIQKRTSHQEEGLGGAYWEFAKDLAYENKAPRIGPPDFLGGGSECELFEQPDPLSDPDTEPRSSQRDPIEVDEHTIDVDPATLDVDVGDGGATVDASLEALASGVYELDFVPLAQGDDAFYLTVTLSPDEDDEMRLKLYNGEDEGTKECWEDDNEVGPGGSAGMEVWEGDEEAVLLVSNLEHDSAADYELVFQAFPMWPQTGHNAQNTYWIEQGGSDGGSGAQVQTMSADPPGTASFQQDERPGSLLWRSDASGGISRPTYAYGQVYTVYGQGAAEGILGGDPTGGGLEGMIIAHDAETGETVWEANDEGAEMNIGGGADPGRVSGGVTMDLTSLQHEAIVGSGHVYVPGGEAQPFYPPGQQPNRGPEPLASYGGVLAFDAEDGSLAWEAKPPHDAPHELTIIDQIVLDQDTLYIKGALGFHTQTGTGLEHKLWAMDAQTGGVRELWSAPYEQAEMVIEDDQAIVAGWGSPAEIVAIDLASGDEVWKHTDVFSPPPEDDEGERDTFTAGITDIVSDDGDVYVGTMIRDPDGLRGAVYAFDGTGANWRYGTDEMSPTPAVNEGKVYAMTGTFEVSDEDEQDPEEAFDQASILHAVDAARNETDWAVNASTTMTVAGGTIYVGKMAPIGDPFGASVAALDAATGQVKWVNEEDVNGPLAWTGAYVDDVLYVNTQANIVALNG